MDQNNDAWNLIEAALLEAIPALEKIVGAENVSTLQLDKIAYAADSSPVNVLHYKQKKMDVLPHAVIWPGSPEEISQILRLLKGKGIPVIAYGGGSGVTGGTMPVSGGIVLDLKRLDKIINIDAEKMIVEVEAGIIGEILERKLNEAGFTLGHFPGSIYSATLGGYLAARGVGQYSSLYGTIVDMVYSLDAVLADGTIINSPERNRTGIQVEKLLMGSEGTLGIITSARLRICHKPEIKSLRSIKCDTVEDGLHLMQSIIQSGLKPALFRLYDEFDSVINRITNLFFRDPLHKNPDNNPLENIVSSIWETANSFGPFRVAQNFITDRMVNGIGFVLRQAPWINHLMDFVPSDVELIISFEGNDAELVEQQMNLAIEMAHQAECRDGGELSATIWYQNRFKMAFHRSPIFFSGAFAERLEVAVPWERALPLYHRVKELVVDDVFIMAHFSHAYRDGCNVLFTIAGATGRPRLNERLYQDVIDDIMRVVLEEQGTVSHHHGIGLARKKYLAAELGSGMRLLRAVKQAMDPEFILNPGKQFS